MHDRGKINQISGEENRYTAFFRLTRCGTHFGYFSTSASFGHPTRRRDSETPLATAAALITATQRRIRR